MTEELAHESFSASRQKSCSACVKGKRGCDKRRPICSRCEEKNVQCLYGKRVYAEAFPGFDLVDLDISWEGFNALTPSFDPIDDSSQSLDSYGFLDHIPPPRLDTSNLPLSTPSGIRSTASSNIKTVENGGGPSYQLEKKEQAPSGFNYGVMAELCIQYEPWQVYDPNSRVHFIIKSLKSYPSTFAKDNNTPWMHKYLYREQMPQSIQSCFTVSTIYVSMNKSNKMSVFRILFQRVNDLKQLQCANTPREKLARVQALFLYQIIGLFDGDVTLRSNTDRSMPLLQDWLHELCTIRDNLGTPTSMNDLDPPTSWELWIFSESVRRTIIMAYAFLGLWNIICNNNDALFFSAWKYPHCWTMSRPLWEAPSSFEFIRAWKPYHIIKSFEFETFLKSGMAEDMDGFAKVLMVAYMGLDQTKQWFIDKKCPF